MSTATGPKPMTVHQARVLRFIWNFTLEHGYQPTFRETSDALGFATTNAILCHLNPIARKGWIVMPIKGHSVARAIKFLHTPDGTPFGGLQHKDQPGETS